MVKIVILLAGLMAHLTALEAKFTVLKHYVEDRSGSTRVNMGRLAIFEEGEVNQAYFEPEFPTLVTAHDLANTQTVILTFKEVSTGQTFTTAVTNVAKTPHSEKIMVIISGKEEIIGFNYVQTRIPNQDISVDFMTPDRGVEYVLKAEPQNKPAAQEESFFQKYVQLP